mmetsp:Transcript_14938/g.42219  ORF Transcript_14938/g.42219 Transcript_14938/m.42219 type:complete len:265 (+) Transcript_14938:599-1393(+)
MRHKDTQTGQEEKDQARNQNITEHVRRHQHHPAPRRRQRHAVQNPVAHLRARQQHRLQNPLPNALRLRHPLLHIRTPQGLGLLPLQRGHAQRRQAPQRHDRPRKAQAQTHRLGIGRVLPSRPRVQRARGLPVLQGTGAPRRSAGVRLLVRHVESRLHVCWHDLPKGTLLPRPRQLRPARQDREGPGHRRAIPLPRHIRLGIGPALRWHSRTSLQEILAKVHHRRQSASRIRRSHRLCFQAAEIRSSRTTVRQGGHGASVLCSRA